MTATAPNHVLTSTLTLINLFCNYFFSIPLCQAVRGGTLLVHIWVCLSSWYLIGFHVFVE